MPNTKRLIDWTLNLRQISAILIPILEKSFKFIYNWLKFV